MNEVRIRPLKDGPVEISGPVVLVDAAGTAAPPPESPVYLCRCGHSATKPFCDGSHKRADFRAEGWSRSASRA